MALQMPTTQKIVTSKFIQANGRKLTLMPPMTSSTLRRYQEELDSRRESTLIVDDAHDEEDRGADQDRGALLQHASRGQ